MEEKPEQTMDAGQRPMWADESTRFLRRTLWATVGTLAVVASILTARTTASAVTAYIVAGVWGTGFFALTALAIKAWLFERKPGRAMMLLSMKAFWFMSFVTVWVLFRRQGGTLDTMRVAPATLGGLATPLVVASLRFAGMAMGQRSREQQHAMQVHGMDSGARWKTNP